MAADRGLVSPDHWVVQMSVLIVDDRQTYAEWMIHIVSTLNVSVIAVFTESEAWNAFREDVEIRCVVSDRVLEKSSPNGGAKLLSKIKLERPDVTTILVSAYLPDVGFDQARDFGIDYLISKDEIERNPQEFLKVVKRSADVR